MAFSGSSQGAIAETGSPHFGLALDLQHVVVVNSRQPTRNSTLESLSENCPKIASRRRLERPAIQRVRLMLPLMLATS